MRRSIYGLRGIAAAQKRKHEVAGFEHQGKQDLTADSAFHRIHFNNWNFRSHGKLFEISISAADTAAAVNLVLNRFCLTGA